MKAREKFLTALALTTSSAAAISVINKLIFLCSTKDTSKISQSSHTYEWRYGKINYTKCGSGKPILLIHDIDPSSSGYEWHGVAEKLSKERTVYTIDLLGCGLSDKPSITYTNFVFVQLINNFVHDIIGKRTDVMTLNRSSSVALMACRYNERLFDKLFLINPESIEESLKIPSYYDKGKRILFDSPFLGTLVYNIAYSRKLIYKDLLLKKVFNPCKIKWNDVLTYHKAAHYKGEQAKYLFSSIKSHYVNINISSAVKEIDNTIYILFGEHTENYQEIGNAFKHLNPSIEWDVANGTKELVPIENVSAVIDMIHLF